MLKNLIFRLILILVITSSLLSIYRQVKIIQSAQSSVSQIDSKIKRIEVQNKALQEALK